MQTEIDDNKLAAPSKAKKKKNIYSFLEECSVAYTFGKWLDKVSCIINTGLW